MFKGSIKFKKIEPARYPIQINKGMDTFNSAIGNKKLISCKNIDITDFGYKRRSGLDLIGIPNVNTLVINGMGIIKKESGDILIIANGTKLQKLPVSSPGSDWTDITTITNTYTEIVSFVGPNHSISALKSGTATGGTSRTLTTTGMTTNQYVSKYLLITSGTGSGQQKLITSNTTTIVFIEGLWETTPDGTSVFEIRDRTPCVYITNGTDNFMKYDGTTLTSYSSIKKFNHIEVSNNRLFGVKESEDILYYSDLGVGNFPSDNFIPIDPDGDIISGLKSNQDKLIIYKRNSRHRLLGASPEFFQLVKSDSNKGAISSKSICNGNNMQFFMSNEGVESYNTLENSTLEEGLPISKIIDKSIKSHSTAELMASKGMVYKNKLFMSIGSKVYVYDIEQSAKKEMPIWTVYEYIDTIEFMSELQGNGYIAHSDGAVFAINSSTTTDSGNTIETRARIGRATQKDSKRLKNYLIARFDFEQPSATCDVSVYVAYEGGSQTLLATVDIYTTPEIIINLNVLKKDIDFELRYTSAQQPEFIGGEISYHLLSKI